MEIEKILAKCDYTLLDRCASPKDIEGLVERGERYGVASVCIPPCYVDLARRLTTMPICTVIGFPNGYNASCVKLSEAERAFSDGADELDMVINVGRLKSGDLSFVQGEIEAIKRACDNKILKVIIEASLLTDDEKATACRVIKDGGGDYVKTSTGFAGGATEHDVELLCRLSDGLKVKAAGGIRSVEAAQRFIELGAQRIGTSGIIKDALSKGLIK